MVKHISTCPKTNKQHARNRHIVSLPLFLFIILSADHENPSSCMLWCATVVKSLFTLNFGLQFHTNHAYIHIFPQFNRHMSSKSLSH